MKKHTLLRKPGKGVYVLYAVLVALVLFAGYHCGFQKICKVALIEKAVRSQMELKFPKGSVYAEVVDTPASRAQGLSGREDLSARRGMLFVFEHPGKYGFWMKDMLFPIDIIWISEDGVVVHIERHVTPASYFEQDPPQTFINKPDAKYVLEVAEGQSEKLGIYLGTKVKIGN